METAKQVKRACATCQFSELKEVPGAIQRARFCFRMPPTPIPVQGPGGQPGFIPMFPIVAEENWCYEWKPSDAANSANGS